MTATPEHRLDATGEVILQSDDPPDDPMPAQIDDDLVAQVGGTEPRWPPVGKVAGLTEPIDEDPDRVRGQAQR